MRVRCTDPYGIELVIERLGADLDRSVSVSAHIRYGRRSRSMGNTFTMTIDTVGDAGRAVVVRCLASQNESTTLFAEAEALWQAERPNRYAGGNSC